MRSTNFVLLLCFAFFNVYLVTQYSQKKFNYKILFVLIMNLTLLSIYLYSQQKQTIQDLNTQLTELHIKLNEVNKVIDKIKNSKLSKYLK